MEALLMQLDKIYELLEQINMITLNQATVLLEDMGSIDDENTALELLEGMVECKEEVTNQLIEEETKFDQAYEPYKGKITAAEDIQCFKERVDRILKMKKSIVDSEKNNVMLMQSRSKKCNKAINIPKEPEKVVAAYKKQQLK